MKISCPSADIAECLLVFLAVLAFFTLFVLLGSFFIPLFGLAGLLGLIAFGSFGFLGFGGCILFFGGCPGSGPILDDILLNLGPSLRDILNDIADAAVQNGTERVQGMGGNMQILFQPPYLDVYKRQSSERTLL